MIKFGSGGKGAVGPIACSVQPGRPADNTTDDAYGLLYAWKKPASVLPEWNMDRWEAQNLVLFQSSPFFLSFSLSLSLCLFSLERGRD